MLKGMVYRIVEIHISSKKTNYGTMLPKMERETFGSSANSQREKQNPITECLA